MPLVNPVPVFNFTVVLLDAQPPSGLGAVAGAALGAAASVAKALLTGTFSEVSGLNAEMESEEYREGGLNTGPHKFVKWGKYPNLVFKRGVTFNTDLWDWYYQALYGPGPPPRKNGIVVLADRAGGASSLAGGPTPLGLPGLDRLPVAVWFFNNGLPEKLQGPPLNAKNNEIAVETLEIVHEGLVRVGPGMIPGVGAALSAVGSVAASVSVGF
jgi:phage tail-like protein